MRIVTRRDDTGIAPKWASWSAIDNDSYEGPTPDEPGSPIGYGETPEEAIADLREKLGLDDEMEAVG
jgi:hypothetical protein